jgi:heptosyltransferase III
MNNHSASPSYLIVCFRFIGDVLVTTPLALSIKTANPDAVVDYLVFKGTEKVLAKNPYIRNVITVTRDTSGFGILLSLFRKYDIAIAAYPSDRTAMAAAIAGKQSVGLTYGLKKEWWKCLVLDTHHVCCDRIHVVSNILKLLWSLRIEPIPQVVMGYDESDTAFARSAIPFDRYIILHPYSMKEYKYWSAEKWASLASMIQENTSCVPVFTKTPEPEGAELLEKIQKHALNDIRIFDAPCTLNQLAAIVKGATAFVGIDTAVTHMAAALNTPTIAIFGPTLTRYWAPWPNGNSNQSVFAAGKGIQRHDYVTVVQKEWSCVPCNQESCAISTRGAMECLVELDEHEVLDALMAALDNGKQAQKVNTLP